MFSLFSVPNNTLYIFEAAKRPRTDDSNGQGENSDEDDTPPPLPPRAKKEHSAPPPEPVQNSLVHDNDDDGDVATSASRVLREQEDQKRLFEKMTGALKKFMVLITS